MLPVLDGQVLEVTGLVNVTAYWSRINTELGLHYMLIIHPLAQQLLLINQVNSLTNHSLNTTGSKLSHFIVNIQVTTRLTTAPSIMGHNIIHQLHSSTVSQYE